MSVTISIEGEAKLARVLSRLSKEAEAHVDKALSATGLELRGDIIKRYNHGPATGAIYRRGTIAHQASAAGEAPMTDTGRLAGTVDFKKAGKLAVSVFTVAEYGPYLEFGTMDIEPRPAWVPAVEEMLPKYRRRMETAIRRSMP
jgi:hypothetical protein